MAVNPNDTSRPHVWRPAVDSASARTLLLLHGSGADEHDLLSLGMLLDPTANLLSPRGLVRVDGANRFFLRHDDGTFVDEDIVRNSAELAEFLWSASGEYGFDANNVYAAGFSNGANAAGALLLLQPDSVQGIIAFGTTKSFERTPFKKIPDLSRKRVWIANGQLDHYSPVERTEAMISEFESLGASVSLRMHAGGHTISPQHVREIAAEL
ncbi:MAG: alpha/beta hydrolase [Rhodoluna sp.]